MTECLKIRKKGRFILAQSFSPWSPGSGGLSLWWPLEEESCSVHSAQEQRAESTCWWEFFSFDVVLPGPCLVGGASHIQGPGAPTSVHCGRQTQIHAFLVSQAFCNSVKLTARINHHRQMYKWNHTPFVLLCLACFTKHSFKSHSCYNIRWDFLLFQAA